MSHAALPAPPLTAIEPQSTGVLPAQALHAMVTRGEILPERPLLDQQMQPASLDLRLGTRAYRVQASFLPGPDTPVADKLEAVKLYELDLRDGATFEPNAVYIVPLLEGLALRGNVSGLCNPKSSTGRLDIFARVITDGGMQFDRIRERYTGPLYAEISPRTFPVRVRTGTRLVQLRLKRGAPQSSEAFHKQLEQEYALLSTPDGRRVAEIIKGGRPFTVDLLGEGPGSVIGYRARRHTGVIDVDQVGVYDPEAFWEPVRASAEARLILDPQHFYILASKEEVAVPPHTAAEMLAYDTLMGEFRVHYAGFFDPGFGYQARGTRAVLEVRTHDVPFLIEDGQVVGRLVYERLTEVPETLYGSGIGSNYQHQGLALAKQFRRA